MPELYATIARFSIEMKAALADKSVDTLYFKSYYNSLLDTIRARLDHITTTCATLSSMAEKELRSEPFNAQEQSLIENWAESARVGCGNHTFRGIYPSMFYGVTTTEMTQPNFVVADVHTQPAELDGTIVGKVLHVGTSNVNMALVIAEDPTDSCSTAYIGPVGSYYQHITDNFKRLTDEDWKTMYTQKQMPSRPAWVYSYLASDSGTTCGEPQTLVLGGIAQQPILPVKTPVIPVSSVQASFTPNPTSSSATLTVEVPPALSGKNVTAKMYSTAGEFIRELSCTLSGGGKYTAQWDGTSFSGMSVTSGAYLVRITIGETSAILHCTVTR